MINFILLKILFILFNIYVSLIYLFNYSAKAVNEYYVFQFVFTFQPTAICISYCRGTRSLNIKRSNVSNSYFSPTFHPSINIRIAIISASAATSSPAAAAASPASAAPSSCTSCSSRGHGCKAISYGRRRIECSSSSIVSTKYDSCNHNYNSSIANSTCYTRYKT